MAKFLVQFTVDQVWIDDGFDMTKDRANKMLMDALPFAEPSEFSAAVLPQPAVIVTKTETGDVQVSCADETTTHGKLDSLDRIVASVGKFVEKYL